MATSAAVAFSAWIDPTPPPCRRPEEGAAAATTAEGIERARQTTGKVNFMIRFLEGPKKRRRGYRMYLVEGERDISIGDAIETVVCVCMRQAQILPIW